MAESTKITVTVNGVVHERTVEPRTLLVDLVRDELRLTGTHVGCEEGICGACTVTVDGTIVKSCLMFAIQADGAEVTTVEGLTPATGLSPLQEAFRNEFAVQCGFCTPGMIVAAEALLRDNPDPTEDEVREHLVGNLCRCSGYLPIIAAVRAAAGARQEA
ncbi:(2Fe-2S)-binding protein [Pseudonocardia acidicola]|uniref:(2Fe-2S)-binding protein n=1 Tax=Pseudonocardia acidicola TaxID=2724939 RepID=A0ABX1SBS3_9PSEU|nr:(2Fe-2S)-binding protein [Pseudonocardia acidicola]NMH97801.1 (2Fe-2S)-binding protein [Pseudonocardia acidicola]